VAEEHGEIGEQHLELLRVTADLARNDPAAVAQMYTAAQRMNLNTVGKQADRAEFLALVRGLEGEGWVEVRGMGLAASYGMLCVTEEGHRQLATTSEPPGGSETAEEETERAEPPRLASGGPQEDAKRPWWRRVFWGR
jgi:hypothetical protein